MKILVIPDIHNKVAKANFIIDRENYDKILFLGDYFDDFNDTEMDAKNTALWLKDSLTKENRIHLIGNHDWAYAYPWNRNCGCSGFSRGKSAAIRDVLDQSDFDKLKFYHFEDDFLFVHGGLDGRYLDKVFENQNFHIQTIKDILTVQNQQAIDAAKNGSGHWFWSVGACRGGLSSYGGLIWCDIAREMRASKRAKFSMAVGHTTLRFPAKLSIKNQEQILDKCEDLVQISDNDSVVIGLDSHLSYYGIYDTEKKTMQIKRYSEL